ncbi:MAG: DegV family protein [Lachnospiraceae bacterium]|nr:DegV family protein [Lachnospiraceae bacterium]MBQ2565175.1 DegV family protein [Oscillospiraceae bacterium]
MGNFVLCCDSTADLSKEHFERRDIHYVCFHFFLDGKEYFDDLGQSVPFDQFYQAMADGAETSTSQVNVDEYINFWKPMLEEGKDILHLCLSSGISGTINSAVNAARILEEDYPDRKIYVVDSLGASSGYGLIMETLADKRDEGMDLEELHTWVEEHKLNMHHWFFSTDLTFFVKGGRISKASGWFGGMLNICPLMNMDNEGHLVPRFKIPGKKKVVREIVKKMGEFADGGYEYAGKCFISNAGCYDDARAVADLIEEQFPNLNGKVVINSVGTTIGSHTGPGTVALFFWGFKREN